MVKSITINSADFKALLRNFAGLVFSKQYNKMDYHLWRKVSISRPDDTTVFLEWDNDAVDITFGEESEWHHFVFGDNSFGDFIRENLLKINEVLGDIGSEHEDYNLNLNIAAGKAIANCGNKIVGTAIKENLWNDFTFTPTSTSTSVIVAPKSEPIISSCVIDTKVDKEEFDNKLEALSDRIEAVVNKFENNERKENKEMKGFNFDFGPMNGNVVRMSIYGLAVKNKTGSWVSYDAKNGEIMDVDVFNFDGSKFMYKMPVAINDVAIGDVIVHMSVPMFIVGKSKDGKAVYAVDPVAGERKEIMLTKSPFGFNFVTKVVNFLGNAFNADASNPFGNLGLMMMLSEDNKGMSDMLPFMLMANGGNANGFDLSNPMVMYMMCKDGAGDLPMMLALSGAFNKPAAPHVCNCGQHNQ